MDIMTKTPHYFLELIADKFLPFSFSLRPSHHSYFKQAVIIHSHRLIHHLWVLSLLKNIQGPSGENENVIVNAASGPL